MDYLKEARKLLESGNETAAPHDADESVACYLAGINAALIAIAERLPQPVATKDHSKCDHGLPTGCCAICARERQAAF